MNYIWEFYIRSIEQGIDSRTLEFRPALCSSPYMEMSLAMLNTKELYAGMEVEINPYYRFYPIFKDILNINVTELSEVRERLFQVLIHFIGGSDVRQGLCRQEYYNRFLRRDFKEGVFGGEAWEAFLLFDSGEQEIFLSAVISQYRIGNSLELFQNVLKKLFCGSILYRNQEDPKELLIYLGQKKSRDGKRKLSLLKNLFLGIEYKVNLYWEYHFGILGVEDTMVMNACVLY